VIDPAHVGTVSEPRIVEVEKGQLRFFASATGETNPVYVDEAAALAAGHRALPAPPTFIYCLAAAAPARWGDLFEDLGVEMAKVLHGEQGFTYHRPIYAGDRITLRTRTTDIYAKAGGRLEFVVQETEAMNQDGQLCATMRVNAVVRHG
jgi:acyl dehydratase